MSLFWIVIACVVALVWVLSIVDIFHRGYSGWTTAGWLALVVFLPVVGSMIYWFARKPTHDEVEQQYRAEAEWRQSAGTRPFDGSGRP